MNCEYCHTEFSTREGLEAHSQSCLHKDNPFSKNKKDEVEKPVKKIRKKSTLTDKAGE